MNYRHVTLAVAYVGLSLLIQAGCLLLYRFSQFGQTPFPVLPLTVILLFGALFVTPFLALREAFSTQTRWLLMGGSVVLNIVLSFWIAQVTPGASLYFLAPIVAMVLAKLLPTISRKHAPLLAAMSLYVVCTLLANFTFDAFIPLSGYGLINVGTLFFGITFTQRDRVHRYGRKYAYVMIFIAAISNVLLSLGLGTPLRYVVVAFAAIVLSESADTEVYQRFITKRWLTRVATSNAVSIPIDTIIFTVFAFAGESFATPAWMLEVIITDIVVKLIVGFIAAIRVMGNERMIAKQV